MIFSIYLQVGNLDRSLSFYRDGLGLEVAWNDDVSRCSAVPVNPRLT